MIKARADRERNREKEKAGEIGDGKSGTYDEVTPFFFQSRRVIQPHTHKQYTVKKKQITKESNDRKIVYFLKLFLSRTGARRVGSEKDETTV